MTLLEVAVALGLLAIVMLPLASVFFGGEATASKNREFGDAVAIANGQLAQASGVTYANLGFYESEFQSPPSPPAPAVCSPPLTIPGYNGQFAVDLGACPPNGVSPQIVPTSAPQQVGTVVYHATNYVVWVDGSGGNACAYKQVYSVVSWLEGSGPVHVTQSILVYPGGVGKYAGSQCLNFIVRTNGSSQNATIASGDVAGVVPGMAISGPTIAAGTKVVSVTGTSGTTCPCTLVLSQGALGGGTQTLFFGSSPSGSAGTPDNVTGLTATVPADPAGETEVDLNWNAPVNMPGFYVATWAPDPGGQLNLAAPDTTGSSSAWAPSGSTTSGSILNSATSFPVTGLAPSTSYWFEIVAFSPLGDQWAVSQTQVNAVTLTPPPQPCKLLTLTVGQTGQTAGAATVAKSNGHLIKAITMTLTYSGACTSSADPVAVHTTPSATDPGAPYTLTWGVNQYTYNPPTGLCPTVQGLASTGFITGSHTYTVFLNGVQVTPTIAATLSFSQDKTNPPQC